MSNIPRALAFATVFSGLTTLAGCTSFAPVPSSDPVTSRQLIVEGSEAEVASILEAREALNRALRDRDVKVFAHYWHPEFKAIVAGDGGFRVGREANVEAFERMFAESTYVSGLRTPERVDVGVSSLGDRQAAESGRWVWSVRRDGATLDLAGRYMIFWRKTESGWKVWSESYVTTSCRPEASCGQVPR